MKPLRDPSLSEYLGSRRAACGLILVWFGLPTLVGSTSFLLSEVDDFSRPGLMAAAVWGLIACILGFWMKKPAVPSTVETVGYLWFVAAVLAALAIATFG